MELFRPYLDTAGPPSPDRARGENCNSPEDPKASS
jgi:hypothetical protein